MPRAFVMSAGPGDKQITISYYVLLRHSTSHCKSRPSISNPGQPRGGLSVSFQDACFVSCCTCPELSECHCCRWAPQIANPLCPKVESALAGSSVSVSACERSQARLHATPSSALTQLMKLICSIGHCRRGEGTLLVVTVHGQSPFALVVKISFAASFPYL